MDLAIPVRDITFHYKVFDINKHELTDQKISVDFFQKYKIPILENGRYLVIYIKQSVSEGNEMEPFIENNALVVDLQSVLDFCLPSFCVSTPVKIKAIKKSDRNELISWKPMKNNDYVRIDLFRKEAEYPSFLIFIPKKYSYLSRDLIDRAEFVDASKNKYDFKSNIYIIKSSLEESNSIFDMTYYTITAFRDDKKMEQGIQLSLPTKKRLFIQ
jgi:hypothetical protein